MRLVTLKNEQFIKMVERHFPHVDASKPIPYGDLKIMTKAISKKVEKEIDEKRKSETEERNLESGCTVIDDEGNTAVVAKVDSRGFISFKGRKGSFSPRYWERID